MVKDLPEKRKRYASSQEEEEGDAQMCPCGKAIGSRIPVVGECETYKEDWDLFDQEMQEKGARVSWRSLVHYHRREIARYPGREMVATGGETGRR